MSENLWGVIAMFLVFLIGILTGYILGRNKGAVR